MVGTEYVVGITNSWKLFRRIRSGRGKSKEDGEKNRNNRPPPKLKFIHRPTFEICLPSSFIHPSRSIIIPKSISSNLNRQKMLAVQFYRDCCLVKLLLYFPFRQTWMTIPRPLLPLCLNGLFLSLTAIQLVLSSRSSYHLNLLFFFIFYSKEFSFNSKKHFIQFLFVIFEIYD